MTLSAVIHVTQGEPVTIVLQAAPVNAPPDHPHIALIFDGLGWINVEGDDNWLRNTLTTYALSPTESSIYQARPLLGKFPRLAPGRHKLELTVSENHIDTLFNGEVVYSGNAPKPLDQVRLGLFIFVDGERRPALSELTIELN